MTMKQTSVLITLSLKEKKFIFFKKDVVQNLIVLLSLNYSSEEEILINQDCNCRNPNFCSCQSNTDSSESESEPEIKRKIKVCMFHNTGDQEAQMLAQIKALPEGEMKNSLLETFVKTVKAEQRSKTVESF
jgi:hypothetical protein